jgi:hypothetical protein
MIERRENKVQNERIMNVRFRGRDGEQQEDRLVEGVWWKERSGRKIQRIERLQWYLEREREIKKQGKNTAEKIC